MGRKRDRAREAAPASGCRDVVRGSLVSRYRIAPAFILSERMVASRWPLSLPPSPLPSPVGRSRSFHAPLRSRSSGFSSRSPVIADGFRHVFSASRCCHQADHQSPLRAPHHLRRVKSMSPLPALQCLAFPFDNPSTSPRLLLEVPSVGSPLSPSTPDRCRSACHRPPRAIEGVSFRPRGLSPPRRLSPV
jgi:hypothetical protein